MPFTKVWTNAATAYGTATTWQAISIRNPSFAWTASGSGTNEYYVRTAGGADPGILASPEAGMVYLNGATAAKGTLGSLAAGTWGYGDNDTLGYDTIYVRLSDGTDPDSKLADFVKFYQIPQATEHVRLPATAGSISSDLDQSAVAIGDFVGEAGYPGTAGSATSYLLIDPNAFRWEGAGTAYINLTTAAIAPTILATGPISGVGTRGLYLLGSAMTTLDVRGGNVGVAFLGGETATVATLRQTGESDVVMGSGCALTTVHLYSGVLRLRCSAAITTVIQYGGTLYLEEACGVTTLTQYGGTCEWNSSGTIGTLNGYGGTFDETKCGISRTLTTTNAYGNWTHVENKEAVTKTNLPARQRSGRTNYSAA